MGDDEAEVRAPLAIEVTATATAIRTVRRRFTAWLELDVRPGELSEDLTLAVYEALANVVDHAYGDRDGEARLTAHRRHGSVRIHVADRGGWGPPTGPDFRGHGLTVIRSLTGDVHIATDADGTVVHLRNALPPPVDPCGPPEPAGTGRPRGVAGRRGRGTPGS